MVIRPRRKTVANEYIYSRKKGSRQIEKKTKIAKKTHRRRISEGKGKKCGFEVKRWREKWADDSQFIFDDFLRQGCSSSDLSFFLLPSDWTIKT